MTTVDSSQQRGPIRDQVLDGARQMLRQVFIVRYAT